MNKRILLAPADKKTPERKELVAARRALDRLVAHGILCRRVVKGSLRYVND